MSCKIIFYLFKIFLIFLIFLIFASCKNESNDKVFTLLTEKQTGVDFYNQLEFSGDFNIYRYRNFYNGGGVAIGDVNNDNLNDIFFTSNMDKNKLYINQGNFKFKDVTEEAGLGDVRFWSTGVSMVDINNDGFLDIYVCNSGDVNGLQRENELFINQQDGTFVEKAKEYGLADSGLSTQAAFFDYDRDGDLDCYMLNTSFAKTASLSFNKNKRTIRDNDGGDRLYENQNGVFVDVSEKAGIFGSIIGFGLGVSIGDVNMDGWQDIFISNDYYEKDYLYINQQNKTFKESVNEWATSMSSASMGADIADVNNDLYPDLFVTDMLPESDERVKAKTTFESWKNYELRLRHGYHHQFTRNMLQMNMGDKFTEIGRQANVAATDWSWAPLIADFDLDGVKEIFVANGIFQDLADLDFIDYVSSPHAIQLSKSGVPENLKTIIDSIPSVKLPNYMFKLNESFQYSNVSEQWGLSEPSFSNGSAFGDLDNDGDLDLVVNNVNMSSFVYKNNTIENSGKSSVSLQLVGDKENRFSIGAKVFVIGEKEKYLFRNNPSRGFQSSVAYELIIPTTCFQNGNSEIIVQWPTGELTKQKIELKQGIQKVYKLEGELLKIDLQEFLAQQSKLKNQDRKKLHHFNTINHKENNFSDFDYSQVELTMQSRQGPKLAIADLNNDKLDDFYLCGARGSSGKIYIQQQNGSFIEFFSESFDNDSQFEDVDATFIDVDGDLDLDLVVISGGSDSGLNEELLQHRLYLNENESFIKKSDFLPNLPIYNIGTCVESADFNQDGYADLFIGNQLHTNYHGLQPESYLLKNDGKGNFTAVFNQYLKELGYVRDAKFADLNKDGSPELIVVGHYMPVQSFSFLNNTINHTFINEGVKGLWNAVEIEDIDNDGDFDILLGNHGLNSRLKASNTNPMKLYINDFDENGTAERVLAFTKNDQTFPTALRRDLLSQIPQLQKKYQTYDDYKDATIENIFTKDQLDGATVLSINELKSGVMINESMNFNFKPFGSSLQHSNINSILSFNNFIFVGGNFDAIKPELGRLDGIESIVLNKSDLFSNEMLSQLGIKGVTQDIKSIRTMNGNMILFARNDDYLIGLPLQ